MLDAEAERLDAATGMLRRRIQRLLGRSLHLRHVDAGSCNACESEIKQDIAHEAAGQAATSAADVRARRAP
jgi:hypothetical protein